ncbi:SseB family protein, partial [Streptomyces sp. NPDC054802]
METPAPAWPANELEEVLAASLGNPAAGGRLVEVLGRSPVWIPLPNGGGPDSRDLDLPTMDIGGAAFVPVFSSEQQFLQCVGAHMSFTVAPARDFARGLPPQLGIAVNPGGAVGVPLPPPAVAELCRAGRTPLGGTSHAGGYGGGTASGGRGGGGGGGGAGGGGRGVVRVRAGGGGWTPGWGWGP